MAAHTVSEVASRVDDLFANLSNMAATREWAEACIADPNECHVDALKFPGSHGFTGNEEDESPLARNQIALILAAFHAVNCIGVEPVIDVPDSAELERVMKKVLRSRNGEELIEFPNKVARDNEDFNRKCARYLSWHVIRGKVREPGDGFLDWIVRILRRFECMLEEYRAAAFGGELPPADNGCIPTFNGKPIQSDGRPLKVIEYFWTRHSATFEELKLHVNDEVGDNAVHTWINRANNDLASNCISWRLKADNRIVKKVPIQ